MKIDVIIQKAEDRYELVIDPDKDYAISFGLFGEGQTVKEAIEDFLISQEEVRELYEEENRAFPDLEFRYK